MFYYCWSDYDVWKWTNYPPLRSIEDLAPTGLFTENWLGAYSRPNRYSWAIVLKETGEVVGRCFGMHPDDELRQVELAFEMGRSWWNRGLMTEATKRVIRFFMEDVGMNRVYAWHASGNPASGRVQEKAGMRREGMLRQAGKCNIGVVDQVMYSILAEDYFKEKQEAE